MKFQDLYREYGNSSGITVDSRSDCTNRIYFALKGENHDGNMFVKDALYNGSRIAVADDPSLEGQGNIMVVDDALETLQQLANYHRLQWGGKVLAITGSNGKTTTKELVGSVLSKKYRVLFTHGNLNNHIGVPLTLLRLKNEDIAVIEMGANHKGEIARLCKIADPDMGLITNIGKAHLEGFEGIEGVRKGKGELYDFLAAKNLPAFVNTNDAMLVQMADERHLRTIPFGINAPKGTGGEITDSGGMIAGHFLFEGNQYPLSSSLFGRYNFINMLAAVAIGLHFNVDPSLISGAIACYVPENNRSQILKGKNNRIILDAYNANPTSMAAALKEFMTSDTKLRKMVILGDMLELGENAHEEHEEILLSLKQDPPELVLLTGSIFYQFSKGDRFPYLFFRNTGECNRYLQEHPPSGYYILVKGSRKISLEKTTNYILNC
ncbi:MAG: UDP-N-acetylmuramoyl-tripeptide--D-alanyl-D-alanine ligase [Bacteroidales bacterium]|nr:UDP-N-acetylmuramoyl-tripeptide--D-alanyl-D-alanine ligase [Bacteroidales bacterium]